jgi:hypothetical protein
MVTPLRNAIDQVLIAGNHLASALIVENCHPNEQKSYDQVLEDYGQPCADMWLAWQAIMALRNAAA